MRWLAAAVLPALVLPMTGTAQQWRTVDVSRQLRDSAPHEVRIRYGAGKLGVRPTDDPVLFTMHMRYDEEAVTPVHEYDARDRSLTLGLSDANLRVGRNAGRESRGEMQVALSRRVPMDLDLELGATQARLDFGGLALREVRIRTGASESEIRFDAPNTAHMRLLDVDAGAASVELSGLANANADEVRVSGGVGTVDLDFAGSLMRDVDVNAEIALGKVTVRVPANVGVRVELSRFLAGFDHFGLEKRGEAWYSENWDRAPRRMVIRVKTVFGSVSILRAG